MENNSVFDKIYRDLEIAFDVNPPPNLCAIKDDLGFHIEVNYRYNGKYYQVKYYINTHTRTQLAKMILEMIEMDNKAANESDGAN